MRIGLDINRARGYGRAFCEGVASWVDVREDWRLEMVDVSGPRTALAGLDGLIAHVVDDRTQKRLARLGIPVVADFYRAAQRGFAQVMPDHAAIGALACDHFRERGFTRFAYCGYDGVLFSDARRDGFRAALRRQCAGDLLEYHSPPDAYAKFGDQVIRREQLAPGAADAAALAAWLRTLPPACAVFCAHDLRAFQVVALAQDAGRSVPRDIAVLGVDNDALVCSFAAPRLSSIDNNAFGCGRAAAQCLDDLIAGRDGAGEVRRVAPRGVVARQSTEIFRYPSPAVNDAILFMRRNLARNLTAAEVFDHVGRTHTYLDELFTREVGRTVHGEIGRLRLAEAKRLLATTALPLGDIATRSGFSSARYFTAVFKAAEGVTPTDWRLQNFPAG